MGNFDAQNIQSFKVGSKFNYINIIQTDIVYLMISEN